MKSQGIKVNGSRSFVRRLATVNADKANRFVPKSGTYPQGFRAGGVHCGVKKGASQLDLCLISSERPCSASAVFTTNQFKAAPVQVSKKILDSTQGEDIRSIIINAGNANAVTGDQGMKDAWSMSEVTDESVGAGSKPGTLVMSTGVIGQKLPIDKILKGIPEVAKKIGNDHQSWLDSANAICTTDTFPKFMSREFSIGSDTYRIAGLAKGAGMIHPNMATLLGFFVTDAPVTSRALNKALKYATERSFNSISVDGDTSTNDTIAALANGAAGGETIDVDNAARYGPLESIVTEFSQDLAKLVVRDGEGATKFVTINVTGAPTYEKAKQIAESISTSSLVKTALYGKDANWGRILCAIGYSGVPVTPANTSVSFIPSDGSPGLKVLVNGEPEAVDEARASEVLELEDVEIRVNLKDGSEQATVWTCDLSHEYVTINGDYRSWFNWCNWFKKNKTDLQT